MLPTQTACLLLCPSLTTFPPNPTPVWSQPRPSRQSGSHHFVSAWILAFGVFLVPPLRLCLLTGCPHPTSCPRLSPEGLGSCCLLVNRPLKPLSLCFSPMEYPRTLSQTSDADFLPRIRTTVVASFGSCDLAAGPGHLSVAAGALVHPNGCILVRVPAHLGHAPFCFNRIKMTTFQVH